MSGEGWATARGAGRNAHGGRSMGAGGAAGRQWEARLLAVVHVLDDARRDARGVLRQALRVVVGEGIEHQVDERHLRQVLQLGHLAIAHPAYSHSNF